MLLHGLWPTLALHSRSFQVDFYCTLVQPQESASPSDLLQDPGDALVRDLLDFTQHYLFSVAIALPGVAVESCLSRQQLNEDNLGTK